MTAKLRIDIPSMNWAYTILLDPFLQYSLGTDKDNVIPLPPGTAEAHHALIAYRAGWVIEDLGSGKGTLVNDGIIALDRLKHRDVITIGECRVSFQNPSEEAGVAEKEHTQRVAEERQAAFQNVVTRAEAGQAKFAELEKALYADNVVPIPLTQKPEAKTPVVGIPDMIWAAQKLAAIMSEVVSKPGGREEAYAMMLGQLRDAIKADNGFVAIPSESRWHIRAWVGESNAWTQYEQEHPLPLTVTNRALQTKKVVSNALEGAAEEPIASLSLKQLRVSSYIAVPFGAEAGKRGVLYFDTRKNNAKFAVRDVKLLELAGGCILQIEQLPG
uniref:FHA domain-containing protein n=1 Tax=uncultured bacterium AOCefta2 TaxID=654977 RepID=D6MLV9_9BACT|nr:hypothetical protein WISOIL_0010 [uncultured bacterium AOCefta2]